MIIVEDAELRGLAHRNSGLGIILPEIPGLRRGRPGRFIEFSVRIQSAIFDSDRLNGSSLFGDDDSDGGDADESEPCRDHQSPHRERREAWGEGGIELGSVCWHEAEHPAGIAKVGKALNCPMLRVMLLRRIVETSENSTAC